MGNVYLCVENCSEVYCGNTEVYFTVYDYQHGYIYQWLIKEFKIDIWIARWMLNTNQSIKYYTNIDPTQYLTVFPVNKID